MTSATVASPTIARRWPWGETVFPLGLLALGVLTLVDALSITVPGSSNTMGPRAFPFAVGAVLLLAGVGVLVALARGHSGLAEDSEDIDASLGVDWVTVAKLTGSFAALVVLVEPLGWPIAATVLFGGSAWSLGARPWWRPALVGAVLAVIVHVLFTQVLGLFLPAGPLEGVPYFG